MVRLLANPMGGVKRFNTHEGMESVMESGPWLVRGVPLILNIWNQNSELKKDAIKSAPLWVKLHHVPIVAYSEIGLSLITTQLRVTRLPKIEVEYEWNPPRCNTCKVFDHVNDKCPKNPKVDAPAKAVNDGFTLSLKEN
ncbi:zinc knuckle CX2CX4HX4C containing protein [Tanacetum coccineum]|uniref:Zinc knuckle CX2CX4HX4C containing protein n=1 Tax=Tanacetum coccineum TaxID=301880 RepID=A0ABQ5FGR4_9ASTR